MSEANLPTCGITSCVTVCPSNISSFERDHNCDKNIDGEDVITLKFLTSPLGAWSQRFVDEFNKQRRDVRINLIIVDFPELRPNILNEAKSKTGIFDGFITPIEIIGSIVEDEGWADFRPYIESEPQLAEEWSDIMVAYRTWIAQYQGQILAYPLDGDALHLYYRKDVFEAFGLDVPRTWVEYNYAARVLHGKVFKNQTLSGSCVGRVAGCGAQYWTNLVLSSMTQTRGPATGHLFATSDMRPLFGEAMLQTLDLLETQAKYGARDEMFGCVDVVNDFIVDGSCAMTYNWGDTFMSQLRDGSVFRKPGYELGVAPTPGSTEVLDRETMKLVRCDPKRCPNAEYHKGMGWVNRSPYLAFGGWSCAVNNYTTPGKKDLAAEFCIFASSKEQSMKVVVGNATDFVRGSDPFRKSHLDKEVWVRNGYDPDSVDEYFEMIQYALTSQNVVTDIRFPLSAEIYRLLDAEVHKHLDEFVKGEIPRYSLPARRQEVSDRLARSWEELISNYNAQATSRSTLLQQYQKLRGVYSVEVNRNHLQGGIVVYGHTIAAVVLVTSLLCGFWTYRNRRMAVIRVSQPFFLILIAAGVFVFGSSIIPMAIDDSRHSVKACNKACMAVPWLAFMGWSILFAAMYAKIRRVNLVIRNVKNFKTVKVTEKDVMLPFAVLFTTNLALLLVWTLVDPLFWDRRQISSTESYGVCSGDAKSATWKVILSILSALNGSALIGANVEAWKARKVDTAFGESSYIGLIMVSFLQVFLVGVPLSFLVNGQPTARFFVNSSMAFVVCMSVLCLLFLPKFVSSFRKSQGGKIVSEGDSLKSYAESIAIVEDLRHKIQHLQLTLNEAGLDGKSLISDAGLDQLGSTAPIKSANCMSSIEGLSSSALWERRNNSLEPVAEEGSEDETDSDNGQGSPSCRIALSSISKWVKNQRSTNSMDMSEAGIGQRIDNASLKKQVFGSMMHDGSAQ